MNLEQRALMIRYKAAMSQITQAGTTDERVDLLADVVFPSENVYNASIKVAKNRRLLDRDQILAESLF